MSGCHVIRGVALCVVFGLFGALLLNLDRGAKSGLSGFSVLAPGAGLHTALLENCIH